MRMVHFFCLISMLPCASMQLAQSLLFEYIKPYMPIVRDYSIAGIKRYGLPSLPLLAGVGYIGYLKYKLSLFNEQLIKVADSVFKIQNSVTLIDDKVLKVQETLDSEFALTHNKLSKLDDTIQLTHEKLDSVEHALANEINESALRVKEHATGLHDKMLERLTIHEQIMLKNFSLLRELLNKKTNSVHQELNIVRNTLVLFCLYDNRLSSKARELVSLLAKIKPAQ